MTAATLWDDGSPGPTRIKICGLTRPEDIQAAAASGAHAVGLVLASGSPRRLSRQQAERLAAAAPPTICPVTLLVDPNDGWITHGITAWTQLHGAESIATVETAAARGPLVKAVPWSDTEAIREWDANPHVARLLIDSPHGGSGEAFDHVAFARTARTLQTPWILAGGLTPDTVGEAIRRLRPWGVDVSSGVESSRGVKCAATIAAFCAAVQAADG